MIDRTTPPRVNDIPDLSEPVIERLTLVNGVELVMLDSGEEQVTRITLLWNGGQYEADNPAAAHLISKLLKDSSPTLSPEKMADLLDSSGAWTAGELKSHHLTFTLFSINSQLGRILPKIVEIVNNPAFPSKETETLKNQLASRRELMEKKVTFQVQELENARIFGQNHPAAITPGSEDYLAVDTTQLQNLYKKMYLHQAPTVYVAGKISEDVRHILINELSNIKVGASDKTELKILPFTPRNPGLETKNCPEALQSAILVSMESIPRSHPDYERLRAVVTALGGYFGSRLMTVIREEKGLTYGISAALLGHHEGSFITISSQCDNAYVDDVIRAINEEIHRLANEPMDIGELTTLKRYIKSTLAASFDTPFSAMDYFTAHRLIGTPSDYLERQQRAMKELTPELIMELADKYIVQPKKFISVAGKIQTDK